MIRAARLAKIHAYRLAESGGRCPDCCSTPAAPYRRTVDGKITEGCINAAHSEHFTGLSESWAWHMRPWAVEFRTNANDRLLSLFAGMVLK